MVGTDFSSWSTLARVALSLDGSDEGFESCLLSDHVPHDEYSLPVFLDETTFHRTSITSAL
jgi:hypothetical protein